MVKPAKNKLEAVPTILGGGVAAKLRPQLSVIGNWEYEKYMTKLGSVKRLDKYCNYKFSWNNKMLGRQTLHKLTSSFKKETVKAANC